jgi:glycerol-3-phosphate dehydrogenase (NAD(P)+)
MAEPIGIIGGGAWGTALALLLSDKGLPVTLWMFEQDLAGETARTRENRVYLPGFKLPASVTITSSLEAAARDKPFILSVVPSHTVRAVSAQFAPYLSPDAVIISASKGIEIESLKPLAEVFEDTLPWRFHDRLCFLSGPSFAKEVAKKMPTAVALASFDPEIGKQAQRVLSTTYFRVYTNPDVIGVELGGAVKNVIAIAAGVLEGLGFGHNTMAALITRGLAEMARLGTALGADPRTFSGLAGIGDLVLTCTGDLSRNRTLGVRLGTGEKMDDILRGMQTIAEGVKTAKATREIARKYHIEMPVVEEVYQILYEGKDPRQALRDLMARELKGE